MDFRSLPITIWCPVKSISLSLRSVLLCIVCAAVSIGSPLAAASGDQSPCLKIPTSIHASKKVWCRADDIEFSDGIFGRFGLYTDAPSETISTWFQNQEVDPWLRISTWDIPKVQVSRSTQDQLEMRWSDDCKSVGQRFYLISFYKMKTKAGKPFWFGLHLESRVGLQQLDALHEAFDRQWRKGNLRFERVSTRPVFDDHEPRFKGASSVKTLDEAISLVFAHLSDEEKSAVRGKSWIEQYRFAEEKGLLQTIREDFELDSDCAPLSDIHRKSDNAWLPNSWVPDFIFKGAVARIDGRAFVVEDELGKMPLIAPPPPASKGSQHP